MQAAEGGLPASQGQRCSGHHSPHGTDCHTGAAPLMQKLTRIKLMDMQLTVSVEKKPCSSRTRHLLGNSDNSTALLALGECVLRSV